MLRDLFMFLIGSGIYTLEFNVFIGSNPPEGEIHVFPRIAVPMLVRLDPSYFYSRHHNIREQFPKILATWAREQERLLVIRHTISDLLTVDGISPEAVFTRVVQTMEHFHGVVSPDEGRYVSKLTWRRFFFWLGKNFPELWSEGTPEDRKVLLKNKELLINRIGGK